MKYIITESRLNKFINSYLDNFVISRSDSFIIVSQPVASNEDNWEDFMEYDFDDGRLWIGKEFKQTMMDLFSMSEDNFIQFIKKWFSDNFDVKIKYTA